MEKEAELDIDKFWPKELLYWRRMSSADISAYLDRTPLEERLVLIVWGVLESHGPFIPLASDSHLAALAADKVASRLNREHGIQPIIFDGWKDLGSRSATWNFPGAIAVHSSGMPVIREMWEQTLARMVKDGFHKFFLVNGDGGNWMNHWYGLKWDSSVIRSLEEDGARLEGANWDQEGGEPYMHGGHHEHALTTWACKYAPEFERLSAIRHGLNAPDESLLKELGTAKHKYLEDVPHRERDWSSYPDQQKLLAITEFSYNKYRSLLYDKGSTPLKKGGIQTDFNEKTSYLLKRVLQMFE